MKLSKLIITAVTCIVLVLSVLFSGCGNNADTKKDAPASGETTTQAANSNGNRDIPTRKSNMPS